MSLTRGIVHDHCSDIKWSGTFNGRKDTAGKFFHTRTASIENLNEFGHSSTGLVFAIVERPRMLSVCRAKSRTAENFYNTFKLFSSGTIKSLNGERDKSSPDFKKLKEGCVFRSILPPLTVPCRREQTRIQIIFGGEKSEQKQLFYCQPAWLHWKGVCRIHNQPEKILGWKTSQECFAEELRNIRSYTWNEKFTIFEKFRYIKTMFCASYFLYIAFKNRSSDL